MNDPEKKKIVVFSEERNLFVAGRLQEDEDPQVMDFNHFLERIGAPFRVHLTDDEETLSDLAPHRNMNPDYIVPHDEE